MTAKLARVFLVGGVVALVLAGGLWLFGGTELPTARVPAIAGAAFTAEVPDIAPESYARWDPPEAQSMGREWIFEIFTPPLIYFDPETVRFTLTPPLAPEEEPPFGVRLVAIERELYRAQYAGHAGAEGRYFVELEDTSTGRYYRGRAGEVIPEMELEVRGFSAGQRMVTPAEPGGTPYLDRWVELTIFDRLKGETVVLTAEPRYAPEPLAVFVSEDGGTERRRREGETFRLGEATFEVEAVDRLAGRVRLAKRALNGELLATETLTLPPASTPAPSSTLFPASRP